MTPPPLAVAVSQIHLTQRRMPAEVPDLTYVTYPALPPRCRV